MLMSVLSVYSVVDNAVCRVVVLVAAHSRGGSYILRLGRTSARGSLSLIAVFPLKTTT